MQQKIIFRTLFLILISLGFLIHGDYGIGVDEPTNRQNGIISTKYILSKIQSTFGIALLPRDSELESITTNLEEYADRDYGVLFDVPALIFERILKIDQTFDQYKFRKILTYLTFIAGLFALYKMVILRFSHYYFGLLAVAVMIFSPRVFGESFYNSKDIVFMAFFTIALYRMLLFISLPTRINAIYFGLATACAIDIRIIAIVLPFMVTGLVALKIVFNDTKLKFFASALLIYYLTGVCAVILFWPWLWADPFARFAEAFNNMSHFRLNRWELFNGHFHTTSNLPWHYLPTWILITTPITYIVFFVIGLFATIWSFIKVQNWRVVTDHKIQDLTYLMVFLGPIVAAVFMNSVVYNGWRHFYFIYPAMVLIVINGVILISQSIYKPFLSKTAVMCVLFFTFAAMTLNMISAHPWQYVYFHNFAGNNLEKKYPMDYASLSAIKGFEYLYLHESKRLINIAAFGPLNITLQKTLLILPRNKRMRFQLVNDLSLADYIFSDYQFFSGQESAEFYKNLISYESIFDLRTERGLLFSIFKPK